MKKGNNKMKNVKDMTNAEYLEYIKRCAEKAGGMQAIFAGPLTWEDVYEDAKIGIYYSL